MRKKFKAKKKKKKLVNILVIFICTYLVSQIVITSLSNIKLTSSNEEFLRQLMYNSNHYLKYEKKNGIFTNLVNYILSIDFSKPLSIVSKESLSNEEEVVFMVNTYLEDPNKEIITNPRVYIYNSHQGEGYSQTNYEKYGISPSVMMATYLLKEKLNDLGINTIAEEGNIVQFMNTNGYPHSYSYIASRYFIEPVIKENNFDLIIDIHRDSNKKSESTIVINGKSYAKTLFVVGLENKDYEKNLWVTSKIDSIIKEKYPGLSRGIYKKEGEGVDGVYNQDLNPKIILLEVGGYQNTVSEVNNTLDAIAEVINTYLGNL